MKKPNLKAPNLKAPKLKAPDLGSIAGGSRTGQSLLAGAAVLALVFGVAELRSPVAPAAAGRGGGATTTQVERTAVVCPPPTQGLIGSTTYSLYTPVGATASGGTAQLNDVSPQAVAAAMAPPAAASPQPAGSPQASGSPQPAGSPAAPQAAGALVAAAKPGVPATGNATNGESAPGAFAVATGAYAPGFTVGQTTASEQAGPALSGVGCLPSGTSFWFAGASTAGERVDYVTIVNAETVPAVVDVRMYGDKGLIDNELASGIAVAPGSWQSIRLPGLTKGQVNDLAVNVVARSGRIGAGIRALDGPRGADWLQPSADPAAAVTIPGLPGDTATARLVVAAPAEDDADLKVQVSGKNGWFTPAGHETLHVKAGMTTAVDLGQITRGGEASAIRLSPSDPAHPTPVVAGLRVDRTNKGKFEAAWISGAAPIGPRASIADNRAGQSQLLLTAVEGEAKVRVSSSAGTGGGTPATKEVQIPAGATVAVEGIDPAGLNGTYGITLETLSGGPVVAARILTVPVKDTPAFTIQPLRDDRSTVRIPTTVDDPGVVQ
ncbi:DUF5719 family protein [Kitasatospora sp. NPDC048365]|uniref:DUF5719 family protein n=1 Tax=Kitasatospora sp. NPDC048365 TaxID=3364050 RepID=UPI00371D43B8